MAQAPAATPEDVSDAPAKKAGGKKKLLIIVAAVVALGGGGAAFFLMKGKHAEGEDAHAKAAKAAKHAAPPVFQPLEPFVVNLQPSGSGQYLQTDISLRLAGPEVVDEVKARMPEIRSRVLLLLSGKTAQELLTAEGKEALADAVRLEVAGVVDPDWVKHKKSAKRLHKTPAPAKNPEDEEPAGEKAAAEEAPAEGAEGADAAHAEKEKEAPAPEPKVLSVLFTAFIIQ